MERWSQPGLGGAGIYRYRGGRTTRCWGGRWEGRWLTVRTEQTYSMLRNRGLRGYGEWRKRVNGCRVRACPCLRLPERERERERERLPPVAAASFPSLSANANSTGRFRGQRRLRTVGPDAAHHSVLGADKWARHGVARVSIATLPGAVALFGSPGGVHTSAALCSTPIKLCYQRLRTGQSN
jgi:hypothetical protein